MINNNRFLIGLFLIFCLNQSVNASEVQQVIQEFLVVRGLEFNKPISASIKKQYPPEVKHQIYGEKFDAFSYFTFGDNVDVLVKFYSFQTKDALDRELDRMLPFYRQLIAYYSNTSIDTITWEINRRPDVVSLIAHSKGFIAAIEATSAGNSYLLKVAFIHK